MAEQLHSIPVQAGPEESHRELKNDTSDALVKLIEQPRRYLLHLKNKLVDCLGLWCKFATIPNRHSARNCHNTSVVKVNMQMVKKELTV